MQGKRVLDVGTGTGIWAIDFADQNPGAHVVVGSFHSICIDAAMGFAPAFAENDRAPI